MKKLIAAMALIPLGAGAQMVPAIDKTALVQYEIASESIQLTKQEREALAYAREWKNNPTKPVRAADGGLQYVHGLSLPTLVCAMLRVCAIRFQPGEIVTGISVGDNRFTVSEKPRVMGSEPNLITYITVMPKEKGIRTNLIVSTDRRSYTIQLVSANANHEWVPYISFIYPEDMERGLEAYRAAFRKKQEASIMPTGESLANVDFSFQMSGDSPAWKPVRVFASETHTYIQFPNAKFPDELPALVELGNDAGLFSDESTQMVNYRLIGDRFVVDKRLTRAALISGVGDKQVKVIIDHVGGKKQ